MMSSELDVLLACAGVVVSGGEGSRLRAPVAAGVDWTGLVRRAVAQGLAGLVGVGLSRVAADLVPGELADAFAVAREDTRRSNEALLEELAVVGDALGREIEAIALKGPMFVRVAYGDLGLRACRDLELLVREADLAAAEAVLARLGYGHDAGALPRPGHAAVKVRTRLGSGVLGFNLDYAGLWQRARRSGNDTRELLTLAAEDGLLALAVEGDEELWENLRQACDVAAVIGSHPGLEWDALLERARAQGWLRTVLLAASLARRHFRAAIPPAVLAAERADAAIEGLSARALARWRGEAPSGSGANAGDAGAWRDLGDELAALGRHEEAIGCYDKALALVPDRAGLWRRRKAAIRSLGDRNAFEDIAAKPGNADSWAMRAGALFLSGHLAEAAEASERALSLDPSHPAAARIGIQCRLHACDWRQRDEDKRRLAVGLRAGTIGIGMMDHRSVCDSEEELRLGAELVARRIPRFAEPLWRGERYRHGKIRIAYLSSDFRSHVVGSAIVGCFEHHDRTRFETIGVSFGRDDTSDMRRRIEASFDSFIDGRPLGDAEIATRLRTLEVDIAVDLNGYSGGTRTAILARRPAPVQVNYLGFAGTMAVPFMDYIVADRVVIPDGHRVHYTEQIVYLPHTYMPTDGRRPVAESTLTRIEAGLPESGFVFACQNAAHKIGPEMFGVWMRLLREVDGSVLWLRGANEGAVANLHREAQARGIAPERLLFAPHAPRWEDHLARLRLADLFLDTLPYNAHATACDALSEGLPVLTCLGNSWPGRVAASVLYAIGLPELVTYSLADYEALALRLAGDPGRLAAIRAKIRRGRQSEPLFDTARFTRDLETAYMMMWERGQAGLVPASFAVEAVHAPLPGGQLRCDAASSIT